MSEIGRRGFLAGGTVLIAATAVASNAQAKAAGLVSQPNSPALAPAQPAAAAAYAFFDDVVRDSSTKLPEVKG